MANVGYIGAIAAGMVDRLPVEASVTEGKVKKDKYLMSRAGPGDWGVPIDTGGERGC